MGEGGDYVTVARIFSQDDHMRCCYKIAVSGWNWFSLARSVRLPVHAPHLHLNLITKTPIYSDKTQILERGWGLRLHDQYSVTMYILSIQTTSIYSVKLLCSNIYYSSIPNFWRIDFKQAQKLYTKNNWNNVGIRFIFRIYARMWLL